MSEAAVPMPNERHPSLPEIDVNLITTRTVHYMARRRVPFVATDFGEPKILRDLDDTPRMLVRQRCRGPAPYVGRAFAYAWDAFVETDGTGRAVCGSASIEYLPFDEGNPATWPDPWLPDGY